MTMRGMVIYEKFKGQEYWQYQKKWDKVFKNEPIKICTRQPLKHLKVNGLKQTKSLQIF